MHPVWNWQRLGSMSLVTRLELAASFAVPGPKGNCISLVQKAGEKVLLLFQWSFPHLTQWALFTVYLMLSWNKEPSRANTDLPTTHSLTFRLSIEGNIRCLCPTKSRGRGREKSGHLEDDSRQELRPHTLSLQSQLMDLFYHQIFFTNTNSKRQL